MYTHPSSPISKLPVELLSYIFVLGTLSSADVPSSDEAGRNPLFNTESVKVPLAFAGVSRHWGRVARNTPGLWTSLCITVEMVKRLSEDDDDASSLLNTTHLTSYLALSRNYPLDILIDARDQDWDFFEPEIPSEYEFNTYTPPFSPDHMASVISLLLPHISRWRSLHILTDSWAPMHSALLHINPCITSFGAPLLESLTLMRCNDFVSFSPEFQPRDMKSPAFLSSVTPSSQKDLLPRLKHLSLRGVHVEWASLVNVLSASTGGGLHSLELSSHCSDVRPTLTEFQQLLGASLHLRKLAISGSGPFVPDDVDDIVDVIHHDLDSVPLPHLHSITLGYRTALEGQTVLELLNAPNAKVLVLEDATYPGDPEEVDAGSLLTYIGTGEFYDADHNYLVAYELPDGLHYRVAMNKRAVSRLPTTEDLSQEPKSNAAFPILENVTLKSVRACPRPLRAFFGALPNLQRLELIGMTMHAVRALLPSNPVPSLAISSCPCPQLQSLCIRGFEQLQIQDFDFLVGGLAAERKDRGACSLKEVDIHVSGQDRGCVAEFKDASGDLKVNIFSRMVEVDEDEDYEELDETDAFEVGGVFNDPVFDAYYSAQVSQPR
ncbi:uncharacterized protein LACBIDRAFT_318098 [Laccaria bicolor S238N-H82]|uniref:Predicted protein n=1 Tax=Laccaria bicolor (strain S238N-H82 / ATCC MYA-4686) TaxID=486041 RepID=B0D5Z6_LACBS|nr:uncharacterized protein LACBIDRAFT_318098 [Laccaria bicolor S238N-H82]EDR09855.1 predicted protein [Laccaria bicolor S238N-H82]|eukprot:XP_001879240.1 predicted protein [Laccaria bicolor S238N-H82]